jgi:hypothetical protein
MYPPPSRERLQQVFVLSTRVDPSDVKGAYDKSGLMHMHAPQGDLWHQTLAFHCSRRDTVNA